MRSSKLCKMPTKSSEVLPLSMKHRYTIRALALRHFAMQTFTSSHAPHTKKTHTPTQTNTRTPGGSGDATKSWYENLGSGRADFFSGAIDLSCPIDGGLLDYWTAAVCPLDCELTNKFITRNVMRAKLAAVA